MKKILLAIPSCAAIQQEPAISLLNLCFHNGFQHGSGKFEIVGQCLLPRTQVASARSILAEQALEQKASHILYVDDDMVVPPDLLTRLLSHEKPVVAALAFTRRPPFHPVLFKRNPEAHVMQYAPILDYEKYVDSRGLVKCDAVGFGACLIETRVFSRIPRPWFWFGDNYGEDIFFCDKAGQSKFPIYMDVQCEVGHASSTLVIREAEYRAYLEQRPAESCKRPVYIDGKFVIASEESGLVPADDPVSIPVAP